MVSSLQLVEVRPYAEEEEEEEIIMVIIYSEEETILFKRIWKLIARTISPTPSLFVAQRPSTYSQGNIGKFWR